MQLVRMYSRIATVIHLGKDVIRNPNGWADVPEQLVPHLLATGWSRTPPNEPPGPVETLHALDVPAVAAIESGDAIGGQDDGIDDDIASERSVAMIAPFSVVP